MMVSVLLKFIGYYLLFPILLLTLGKYLYRYKKDLYALKNLNKSDDMVRKSIKKSISKIRKLELAFVITILIFMPFMNIMGSNYCNTMVHREARGGTSFFGRFYRIQDPVVSKIGPLDDQDELNSKIYENESRWFPDQLKKIVDLDRLDKYPGRFTIYRLRDNRIILVYQYVSSMPVLKTYGIVLINKDDQTKLLLMKEETYVFPQNLDDGSKILFE